MPTLSPLQTLRPLQIYFRQPQAYAALCLALYLLCPAPVSLLKLMLETPLDDTFHTLRLLLSVLPAAYLLSGLQTVIFAICMISARALNALTWQRFCLAMVLGGLGGYAIDRLTDGRPEFLFIGLMTGVVVEALVTYIQRLLMRRQLSHGIGATGA